MQELLEYLGRNLIKYEVEGDIIKIGGSTYQLSNPQPDGVIIDDNFNFIGTEIQAENYIYLFGRNYYTLPKGKEKELKMVKMKYIGEPDTLLETKQFLGVHGPFELLNGSGKYSDWCKKAKFLGVERLALVEKNTLAGILKFQMECKSLGIKAVLGETVTVINESKDIIYDVKLYVKDEEGWLNLLSINKIVNEGIKKIKEEQLRDLLGGLYIVLDPKSLEFKNIPEWFKEGYYQFDSVKFDNEIHDRKYLENLQKFVMSKKLKPVAISDAYYLDKEYSHIKRKLNSIGGMSEKFSSNQYFKSNDEYFDEILSLFDCDEEEMFDYVSMCIGNADEIAENCNYEVETSNRHLPKYRMTDEEREKYGDNENMLISLVSEFIEKQNYDEETLQKVLDRVETELEVLKYGDVMDYFLILWDIIKFCHSNNMLTGLGRGSAAGCFITYALGITRVNPFDYDLLFERFLNKGRIQVSLPDVDTDFCQKDRDAVKKYMEERYGSAQVCSVGTYSALQPKAAIKDFSKLAGIEFKEVNDVTSVMKTDSNKFDDVVRYACTDKRFNKFIHKNPEILEEIELILGQPRAKSIHACATMIFPKERDMFHWCPVREQDGMMVSEWEGGEMDAAGFLKNDILGILQLDKFNDILHLIEKRYGKRIDIYSLPLDDKKVYEYFQKGWNGDVFHFGSSGLTGYCKEMLPDNIEDLIAAISLYRPGAMENNFHNEYILRKNGDRPVEYFVGCEDILNNTYGIFCYQESIMRMCQVLGGLSLIEADDVRKSMVKKKFEALKKFQPRFLEYYQANFGVSAEYAQSVWEAIEKSSTYLFNRSHAACYTITGYVCQWLKVHYPLEYWAVAFSYASQEDYPLYMAEIIESGGINILPPDVNMSQSVITPDSNNNALIWNFSSIKRVGETSCAEIDSEKEKNGPYFDFEEFIERHNFKGSKVNKSVVENLILCGAFDEIEGLNSPKERIKLINKYREIKRSKIDKEKDLFEINSHRLENDWWWSLKQKNICGYAKIDYSTVYSKYFGGDSWYPYVPVNKLKGSDSRATIAGHVLSMDIKKSKKGEYAKITLDNNYYIIEVMIWSDQYDDFSDGLKGCKGSIMIINGTINKRNGELVLYSNDDTKIVLLS